MDYRYGSHTVYQIEYHFVWVTKYRYKVLIAEGAGERDLGSLRDQDSKGRGEQGLRTYSSQLSADHGTERDYEPNQGAHVEQTV